MTRFRELSLGLIAGCAGDLNFVPRPSDVPAGTQCEARALIGTTGADETWQLRPALVASPPVLPYTDDDTGSLPYPWADAFGPVLLLPDRRTGKADLIYQALSGAVDLSVAVRMTAVHAAHA